MSGVGGGQERDDPPLHLDQGGKMSALVKLEDLFSTMQTQINGCMVLYHTACSMTICADKLSVLKHVQNPTTGNNSVYL